MTSSQRRWRTGCFLAAAPLALLAAWWLARSLALPNDSPLARMYRTETILTVLANAVDAYHAEYGTYPGPGRPGLDAAINLLATKANYLPGGTPYDAWGRPYRYIPSTAYNAPGSEALRCGQDFCQPETYQLYSAGADGHPGVDDDATRVDNITSWEPDKPWRAVYHAMCQPTGNGDPQ